MENNENKKEGMYLLKDCLSSSSLSWTDGSPQERPKIRQNIALCSYLGQDASTSTWLGPRVRIGNNVLFTPDLVIEEDAIIGDDVIVPYRSRIGARTKLYSGPDSIHQSRLHLGADNEIGYSCRIRSYLTTGNGCKIGSYTELCYVKSLGNNVEIGNNCFVNGSTLADRVTLHDHVRVSDAKIDTDSTLCEHVECRADKIGKNVLIGAYAKLYRGVEIADNLEILPNAQIPEGVHITATEIIEYYRRDEDGSPKRAEYLLTCRIYERESNIPRSASRYFSVWRKRTPLKGHPLGQYVRLRKPLEEQANVPKSAPESTLIRAWRMLNQVVK